MIANPLDLCLPYGTSERGFLQKNIFADQLRLLGPASRVIFDVGAHHGDELPTYLSMFPDAIVHAVEPTPASVAVLREGFGGHARVRIHDIALAERDGTATLHAYDISVRNALTPYSPPPELGREPDAPSSLIPVATWTLDRFCDEHDIEVIDLLKLDTQGAEGRVLAGTSRLLGERRIRLISLEMLFVPLFDQQANADELVAILRRTGYHLYDWYNFAYNDRGQLLFGAAIFLPEYPTEPLARPVAPQTAAPPERAPVGIDHPSADYARRPDLEATIAQLRDRVVQLKRRVTHMREKLRVRDERIEALKSARHAAKR